MKKRITFLFIIITYTLHTQNLIRNGDFEENVKDSFYQDHILEPDTAIRKFVKSWNSIYRNSYYINNRLIKGNPLYDLERAFYTKPFRGFGFILIKEGGGWFSKGKDSLLIDCPFPYSQMKCRGYGDVYQKLSKPLIIDSFYTIGFRFKMGDSNRIQGLEDRTPVNLVSNIGVDFSTNDTFNGYSGIPDSINHKVELQDSILDSTYRWRLIERTIKADSFYKSISITQFRLSGLKYKIKFIDPNSTTGLPDIYGVDFETYIDDIRLLPQWQYLKVSNDTSICSGNTVKLSVLSGAGSYKWRLASQPSSILSTAASLSIKVDTTSMYQVMSPYDTASIMVYVSRPINEVSNIVSCSSYMWRSKLLSASGTYRDSSISASGCKTYYTLNFKRTINDKITKLDTTELRADQDSVSYQWYSCSPWTKLEGETKRSLKGTKGKSYAVILNNGKGCIDTSDCVALGTSSIIAEEKLDWRVYPNPFQETFNIELDKIYNTINIKLYHITGQLIVKESVKYINSYDIHTSNLPSGLYYLQVETESASKFYNLRKE